MKAGDALLIGLLILVIGGLIYFLFGFFNISEGQKASSGVKGLGFPPISTGTTDDGDVSIELTPSNFDGSKLIVNFAANTHSVALEGFDLGKITTLEYEGKVINPLSYPKMSGHHVNSQLVFDLDQMPTTFAIKIAGIPKLEERIFQF